MLTNTLKALTIAVAIGAATIPAANAQYIPANLPPTSHQLDVDRQINAIIAAGRSLGYNHVVANQRGAMYRGEAPSFFNVYLNAGVAYSFEARCDRDCSDLDLVLRDTVGNILRSDRATDFTPGFVFVPNYSGLYRVEVELYQCNAGRCQVGAVVMARA
jgi:hypothetical protein